MSRSTPRMRKFATLLLAQEKAAKKANGPFAVLPAAEKLRPHLATLTGDVGFRTLLSRALALAKAEVSWLEKVQVRADGTLERLGETPLKPSDFDEGQIALLAQLLGLMVAFIGEGLTVRLMCEIWPKLPRNGFDVVKRKKNEKTK